MKIYIVVKKTINPKHLFHGSLNPKITFITKLYVSVK